MYEKKLPFDIDCGIRIAMEVIGGKWKSCIIFELAEGPKRPSELHRLFPEANSRVIDQQLKELETCGIIEKKIYARLPPHSEYSITPAGKTLIPVVRQLEQWGNEFRPAMKKILGMEDGRPFPPPAAGIIFPRHALLPVWPGFSVFHARGTEEAAAAAIKKRISP